MLTSIRYFKQGLSLLFKPGVKRYVITPLLLNILVYIGFTTCAYHYTQLVHTWLNSYLPHWLSAVAWILWLFSFIGILFFFTYIFTTIANIIAAPFNGLLSEKVEEIILGHPSKNAMSFKELCGLLPKTLMRQIQLLFYFLPRAIIILVLFFIPGINVIAGITWFLFASWMMSIQYFDYPFDNNHIGFKPMIKTMKQHRWLHLQLGVLINILSIIPIINLFIIPAAVAAATAAWVAEHRDIHTKIKDAIAKNL